MVMSYKLLSVNWLWIYWPKLKVINKKSDISGGSEVSQVNLRFDLKWLTND